MAPLYIFYQLYKEIIHWDHIKLQHQNRHIHTVAFCSVSFPCNKVDTPDNLIYKGIKHYISLSSPTMLPRISISSTKELFQKALQNFKSLLCPGYQKLPKTPPPHNRFSYAVAAASVTDVDNYQNYEDLEKFYRDFTEQWDSQKEKASKRSKKKVVFSTPAKQEKEVHNESFISLNHAASPGQKNKNQKEKREECDSQNNKGSLTHQRGRQHDSSNNAAVLVREHRNCCMVEKKLRELEMLEMSDVDHVLDIEEVLHYYSRLTCPLYLEIVDKFFMEIYREFFNPVRPAASPRSVNSKLKLRSLRS